MAFVPHFNYDVFVSYARAEDTPDATGQGWVTQFVQLLHFALEQRLGGSDEVSIFFDTRDVGASQQLEEILAAVRSSLAIVSRSYVNRDWTRQELVAFAHHGQVRPLSEICEFQRDPKRRGGL